MALNTNLFICQSKVTWFQLSSRFMATKSKILDQIWTRSWTFGWQEGFNSWLPHLTADWNGLFAWPSMLDDILWIYCWKEIWHLDMCLFQFGKKSLKVSCGILDVWDTIWSMTFHFSCVPNLGMLLRDLSFAFL